MHFKSLHFHSFTQHTVHNININILTKCSKVFRSKLYRAIPLTFHRMFSGVDLPGWHRTWSCVDLWQETKQYYHKNTMSSFRHYHPSVHRFMWRIW